MVTKGEALSELRRMRSLLEKFQQEKRNDRRYDILLKELDRVEALVNASWPLPPKVAADLRFGLFAVRELDDEPSLSDELCALDKVLKTGQA
jgi:hypothetical protein